MMAPAQLLEPEVLPLLGYFGLIAALLLLLLPPFLRQRPNVASVSFGFLALASVATTWTYMFLYFERSFIESALRNNVRPTKYTAKRWLADTSLFNEAWSYVCSTPERWWWSSQLCAFTAGTFTIFLVQEGRRRNVRHLWAYMLLGQIVAISFAEALFCVALSLAAANSTSPPSRRASPLSAMSSILSLATVYWTPRNVGTPSFLPILLAMHALLLLPLLPSRTFPSGPDSSTSVRYAILYTIVAIVSLLVRLPSITYSPTTIFRTLFEHPAQSSISFDVVFATIIFSTWMMLDPPLNLVTRGKEWRIGTLEKAALMVIGAIGGVGTWSATYLALRSLSLESVRSDASVGERRKR